MYKIIRLIFIFWKNRMLTITKQNFIKMIPKIDKLLDSYPKIIIRWTNEWLKMDLKTQKSFSYLQNQKKKWDFVEAFNFIDSLVSDEKI